MFHYRELESADFDAAGDLLTAAYPHRGHEPRSWPRPSPREQPRRWGVFQPPAAVTRPPDDECQASASLVGYAALWRVQGEKFRFDVVVSARHRRRGAGRQLFDIVARDAAQVGAATIQARAYDTSREALAFLGRRGFVETMRMRGFVLDLTKIEAASLAVWAEPTAAPAVSIAAVSPTEAGDGRFWVELASLHESAREGWPDPDPGGPADPMSPADLRVMLMPPGEPPLAFFVARHQDQFVGYSVLARRRLPAEAQFAATAVHPEHRGGGIATALRARCLAVARHAGYSTVRSASGNDALITINSRFGCVETYCEVRLVKRLMPLATPE